MSALGQNHFLEAEVSEDTYGKNLLTNVDIKGIQYTFPKTIFGAYLDETTGLLTVQLRKIKKNGKYYKNKGHYLVYDLDKKKVQWSREISYNVASLRQADSLLLFKGHRGYRLDIHSGDVLWKQKTRWL